MHPKTFFQGLGILAFMLINPVSAQLTAEVLDAYDIANPRIVGTLVVGDKSDKPVTIKQVGLISVTTQAAKINLKASDALRKKVPYTLLSDVISIDGTHTTSYLLEGTGPIWIEASCVDFDKKVFDTFEDNITIGIPVPIDPPKPPDPPKPEPVKSFRVIFVKESGSTLNSAQTAITGAKAVRDYLTIKTTPENGLAGWREYDPQQNVANEQATLKDLWAASKSSITTVPCIVVEVNGNVSILNYPKNTAEALETLKKYGGQ